MTRKEELTYIETTRTDTFFTPNLLVSSKFSDGVLILFSFQVPLILYSNCEDKGNIPSVQAYKYLEDTLSKAQRTFIRICIARQKHMWKLGIL